MLWGEGGGVFSLLRFLSVEWFTSASQIPQGIQDIQKENISDSLSHLDTSSHFFPSFARHLDTKCIDFCCCFSLLAVVKF